MEKTLSPRDNEEILEALSVVQDPDLKKNIVECGFVQNIEIEKEQGIVNFELRLTTPACPVKDHLKEQCEKALMLIPWVQTVNIEVTAKKGGGQAQRIRGLMGVANIIAVASCKGGVGKSTVAVNLAFALARSGASVGIFDADVHGPSLPSMLTVDDASIRKVAEKSSSSSEDGEMLLPFTCGGVKLMSFGFIKPGQSAVMRGPMLSRVINQLITTTKWGNLDYLVIDFPPGTGDIQLTLTQIIPLTCAVIVTTPHTLSLIDVEKGLEMFQKLQVPTACVVENMAFFVCDGCDKKHEIFGPSAANQILSSGVKHVIQIPHYPPLTDISADLPLPFMFPFEEEADDEQLLLEEGLVLDKKKNTHRHHLLEKDLEEGKSEDEIRQEEEHLHLHHHHNNNNNNSSINGDRRNSLQNEDPTLLFSLQNTSAASQTSPAGLVTSAFFELAETVVRETARLRFGEDATPKLMYDSTHGKKMMLVVMPSDGETFELSPSYLRSCCVCAACKTRQPSVDSKTAAEVFPTEITPYGNYAVAVTWNDGHQSSIYSYEMLIRLGREVKANAAAGGGGGGGYSGNRGHVAVADGSALVAGAASGASICSGEGLDW